MSPGEFLRAVWPGEGLYCIAKKLRASDGTSSYPGQTFETIDAAVGHVNALKGTTDVYFNVHTLLQPYILADQGGGVARKRVRVQENCKAARCFFLDLDCGGGPNKYLDQNQALGGLRQFCKDAELPRPLIVNSGNGLHVYWLVDTAIPSPAWRDEAAKLEALARHHGLKFDPSRVKDSSSLLRVVGTVNRKDSSNLKHVFEFAMPGGPAPITPVEEFLRHLDDAIIKAGVEPLQTKLKTHVSSILGSNVDVIVDRVPAKALIAACPQVQHYVGNVATASEPEWFAMLGLFRYVRDLEGGQKAVHKASQGYPGYDPDQVDRKVSQQDYGPTSCDHIKSVSPNAKLCDGCRFNGKVGSPVTAARFRDEVPAPKLIEVTRLENLEVVTETDLPPPPYPYTLVKDGIVITEKDKGGDISETIIFPHHLYPLKRLVNDSSQIEQQRWRVMLPRGITKDFTLDADVLYDRRKFSSSLANQGIYPQGNRIQDMQDYMTAYINELQRLRDADPQHNHLGWTDAQDAFILPDKVICADGTLKPATLSAGAQRSSAQVHKKGELDVQMELLKFYDDPAYLDHQFCIMAALAAPYFYATGHHGMIINITGESGSSKSTTLYTGASLWGNPKLFAINGTQNGATIKARNERLTTMANLPVCVDEITHMPIKDAQDLAMGVTQPGHRLRLDSNGVERPGAGGIKSTIMITTANSSLHSLLSTDNTAGTAGSMRVFEIVFSPTRVHKKYEADDYLRAIGENYGHVGPLYIAWTIGRKDEIAKRIQAKNRKIDEACGIVAAERFWSAGVADALVTGEIAYELGLLPYDPAPVEEHILTKVIPMMRGTIGEEYINPAGVLANYLDSINSNILVCGKPSANSNFGGAIIQRDVHGALLAHFDQDEKIIWVLKKGFKDYCTRIGANMTKVLHDLNEYQMVEGGHRTRLVPSTNIRKVLGAGTQHAKLQSWCFTVNMRHPDAEGMIEVIAPKVGGKTTVILE